MPLTWSVDKVKNWKEVCYRELTKEELDESKGKYVKLLSYPRFEEDGKTYEMKPITLNLQFLMALNIGIGEITQKNYKQVYGRIAFYETIMGANLSRMDWKMNKEVKVPTTLQDIQRHIGMKVNANLKQPAQFTRSVIKSWKDKMELDF